MCDPGPDPLVPQLRAAGCVFAEAEAAELRLTGARGAALEALVARRVAGEPLEHVVGSVLLGGVRLRVDPGVFVPRQRTLLLVEEAVRLLGEATDGNRAPRPGDAGRSRAPGARERPVSTRTAAPVLVDLCCGAGPVAALVARRVPGVRVVAGDLDPRAVACARTNLHGAADGPSDGAAGGPADRAADRARGGPPPVVSCGDLDAVVPPALAGAVDVLAAHVPYVPTGRLPLLPAEARGHEPVLALDGGADGLDVLRRVAAVAPRWLRAGGTLLCEVGEGQVAAAEAAYARVGLVPRTVRDDERGALVLAGRWDGRGRRARGYDAG